MSRPDAALTVFNAARASHGLPPVDTIPRPPHLELVADAEAQA